MMQTWRPLALAAVLSITAGIGVATAQTVIAKNAPPGGTVELVLNSATVASGTADKAGVATFALKTPSDAATDVHVYVDACDTLRRVILIERGLQPATPAAACERKEIEGWFFTRSATTLVVDVGAASPMLWIKQGAAPAEWLGEQTNVTHYSRPSPTGLVVFGGGSFAGFSNAVDIACGDVATCSGGSYKATLAGGATYWFTRFLGAEVSFVKPSALEVTSSTPTFSFTDSLDTRLLTIVGKGGVPIGPVRVYGQGGMNYHRADRSISETIDAQTITVDDTTQVIPAATQSFGLRTSGWGWVFGGGLEGWVTPRFALYGEAGVAKLKGTSRDGGEGGIDDRLTMFVVGVKVHIGG